MENKRKSTDDIVSVESCKKAKFESDGKIDLSFLRKASLQFLKIF